MQIDNESKQIMSAFMQDFWKLVKEEWSVPPEEDTGQYWSGLTDRVSALCKKYENHPAVVRTVLGYLDYLGTEGSGRERKKHV